MTRPCGRSISRAWQYAREPSRELLDYVRVLEKALRHVVVDVADWCDFTLASGDSATEMTIAIRREAAEPRAGVSAVTVAASASSPFKRRRATYPEGVEFDERWNDDLTELVRMGFDEAAARAELARCCGDAWLATKSLHMATKASADNPVESRFSTPNSSPSAA